MVSVVIPTHNRASTLMRAVDSVLSQTYRVLELVVVDDGSEDETAALLSGIKDERLLVIRQKNRGVSAARNAGIAVSKRRFIALLDSDDYFLPQKLEKHLAFMKDTGLAISQTDEIWIRRGKRVNPCLIHQKPAGRIFRQCLEMCMISPSCVMFTREFWNDKGPFDESLPACEDYDLWLRASLKYEVGLVPEKLTVKTGGHPDQLSGRIIGLDLYRIYALKKLLDGSDLSPEERFLTLEALERKAWLYIRGCLKHGKPEEALRIREMLETWGLNRPLSD